MGLGDVLMATRSLSSPGAPWAWAAPTSRAQVGKSQGPFSSSSSLRPSFPQKKNGERRGRSHLPGGVHRGSGPHPHRMAVPKEPLIPKLGTSQEASL